MRLGELAEVAKQQIICLDGKDGKVVFKRYEKLSEKHKLYNHFEKYKDVEVLSVWSEIVAEKPLGYTNIARSVLKCYLSHYGLEKVREAESALAENEKARKGVRDET
jgi:hypothetical protein